jgi:hypothetical protein
MIEVLMAHKAGKPIESRPDAGSDPTYTECTSPVFDFYRNRYRVKEEPKFLFVIYNKYGGPYRYLRDTTQHEADKWLVSDNGRTGDALTMKRYVEG